MMVVDMEGEDWSCLLGEEDYRIFHLRPGFLSYTLFLLPFFTLSCFAFLTHFSSPPPYTHTHTKPPIFYISLLLLSLHVSIPNLFIFSLPIHLCLKLIFGPLPPLFSLGPFLYTLTPLTHIHNSITLTYIYIPTQPHTPDSPFSLTTSPHHLFFFPRPLSSFPTSHTDIILVRLYFFICTLPSYHILSFLFLCSSSVTSS